jgi:adenosylcobinamide-GDP ribazoletransferase
MSAAFRLALSFLTALPVRMKGEIDADSPVFTKSIAFFPAVGFVLGCLSAAVCYISSALLSLNTLTSSFLVVVLLVALTRMLHLDGLADTFDGLLGGRDRDRALEIMKDSHVGSFGVVALICALIAKTIFLSEISPGIAVKTIILFPVCARWAASYAMTTQSFARKDGLVFLFSNGSKKSGLIVPTVITIAISAIVLKADGLLMLSGVFAFTLVFLKWTRDKIGGITGDIIGALIELSEIVALLTSLVLRSI